MMHQKEGSRVPRVSIPGGGCPVGFSVAVTNAMIKRKLERKELIGLKKSTWKENRGGNSGQEAGGKN